MPQIFKVTTYRNRRKKRKQDLKINEIYTTAELCNQTERKG